MSEQRWTAPRAGWYSIPGHDFLGTEQPSSGDAEFLASMDSGSMPAEESRPQNAVVVDLATGTIAREPGREA